MLPEPRYKIFHTEAKYSTDGKEHFSIKVKATKKQEILGTTWLCANKELYDSMEDAKKALKKLQKKC